MKLYTFSTPSHYGLEKDWFLPSIQDDFQVIVEKAEQSCPSGNFMETGWNDTMLMKIQKIVNSIKDNLNEIIIWSDVDVQFFKKIEPYVLEALGNLDMLIQRESPRGSVCAGFIVIRANEKNLRLWSEILEKLKKPQDKNDQDLLNKLLLRSDGLYSRIP